MKRALYILLSCLLIGTAALSVLVGVGCSPMASDPSSPVVPGGDCADLVSAYEGQVECGLDPASGITGIKFDKGYEGDENDCDDGGHGGNCDGDADGHGGHGDDDEHCDDGHGGNCDGDADGHGGHGDDDEHCNDDSDGDGVPDCNDGCPNDPNKTTPGVCGCGVADTDTDGDGTEDCNDGCPNDSAKTAPGICGCGTPDTDTDSDGVADCDDGCPADPNKIDPGQCGCGNLDTDSDHDGTADCNDGCPNDPAKTAPGICGCGTPDTDSDSDGVADCDDGCPADPNKTAPGVCGCGVSDVDTDGDGVADCNDGCPADPNKTTPGVCGCGVSDVDSDGDGVIDCTDLCPSDPNKVAPGICGCGVADTDSDGDGVVDCNDGCPSDPLKVAPGQCGCGVMDIDSDGDGVADCNDGCPFDPLKVAPGVGGCGVADADTDGDGIPDSSDLCPGNPTRALPEQVLPGEKFAVTVTFAARADGFHAITLTDVAPAGWDVSVDVAWTDLKATAVNTPAAETAASFWYGPYDFCVPFTTVYEVRVPVDAEPGTYTFSGSLKYYIEPDPAPPYEQEVTGDIEVRVKEGEFVRIGGVTKGVDGAILPEAAVTLYQNGRTIAHVISDENGNYEYEFSELGDYEVVVSRAGFRDEALSISVTSLAIYTFDFVGDHGLIPDAPSISYVLACISLCKFGEPPLQLSMSRVLDVISAWTYPITQG